MARKIGGKKMHGLFIRLEQEQMEQLRTLSRETRTPCACHLRIAVIRYLGEKK
ncbi:MAG: hypothetical protein NT038_03545 [Euryarchaeota archaeon]|nr:hypothetical protein [Euryarchaeota archaeon]